MTARTAIILAAGKGTRMKSGIPKVLQPLADKPMLGHVIDTCRAAGIGRIIVVYGHGGTQVRAAFPAADIIWVEQAEQLGTGHAVLQALPHLVHGERVLILYGDVPLIRSETLRSLLAVDADLCLLTAIVEDPAGYGRIIRDHDGAVKAITEHRDANEAERTIREINTGIMSAAATMLSEFVPMIGNDNSQREYYLTDLVAMLNARNKSIQAQVVGDPAETEGANDRAQLARLERYLQSRLAVEAMREGLHLMDPARFDVRGKLQFGADCVVDINCVFSGDVTLGNRVTIGANCLLSNCTVGDDAVIKPHSIVDGAQIAERCDVGPYARLRPGTVLRAGAKVGNFVETKKTTLGEGSKANHLSYLGDAQIGAEVNIGAGTITCNYDGVNKFETVLEDGVFIGSNSSLVAPVRLGRNATTGAGSVITQNVEDDTLAVGRAKQRNIKGWKRPVKKRGS